MRACYILLLAAAILLASAAAAVSSGTVSEQSKLANAASLSVFQMNDAVPAGNGGKRSLRSYKTDDEQAERVEEERGIPGVTKLINRLKNWSDKDRRFAKLLVKGESFEKLYKKKADPYHIFTKLRFGDLSDAEKASSVAYQRWAKYFDYWVKRNATGRQVA